MKKRRKEETRKAEERKAGSFLGRIGGKKRKEAKQRKGWKRRKK